MGYAGNKYIQVLHTSNDHWVTIEILGDDEVKVYDSIYLQPEYYVLKQIASIIKSQSLANLFAIRESAMPEELFQ